MPSIIGNTSSYFYSIPYNEGCVLESFTLVNATLGSVTAELAIKSEAIDFRIIPRGTVIGIYEMYVSDTIRKMNSGDSLVLLVTGSVDYQFNTGAVERINNQFGK